MSYASANTRRYEMLDAFGVDKSRPHMVELNKSRHMHKDVGRWAAKEDRKLETAWERIDALVGQDGAVSMMEGDEKTMLVLISDIEAGMRRMQGLSSQLEDRRKRQDALTEVLSCHMYTLVEFACVHD